MKPKDKLARAWPYLTRWERLVIIWNIIKRFVQRWIASIPWRWATWQLRLERHASPPPEDPEFIKALDELAGLVQQLEAAVERILQIYGIPEVHELIADLLTINIFIVLERQQIERQPVAKLQEIAGNLRHKIGDVEDFIRNVEQTRPGNNGRHTDD